MLFTNTTGIQAMKSDKRILLSHGSGGKLSGELIDEVFMSKFDNPILDGHTDSALLPLITGKLAFTTDSFVVDPIFFPGGNIGKLAVCGTVNDLAVAGAKPLYLSASFILEEGFSMEDLKAIVEAMAEEARSAGVQIVTGDTKVVNRGKCDKIFINTSGIGELRPQAEGIASGRDITAGDVVIVNGFVGDHGIAVMATRENLAFDSTVVSDCASLNQMIGEVLDKGIGVRFMRDATRGGLATVLCELAVSRHLGIELDERRIPVREAVAGACEIFGFDPLYVANEGKVVMIVKEDDAEATLGVLHNHPLGREASIIGTIKENHAGMVVLRTAIGGSRIVDMLVGEQLPRIC